MPRYLHQPSRLPGYPVEGGEAIMRQAIAMSDDLVDDIGLWCVERYGGGVCTV